MTFHLFLFTRTEVLIYISVITKVLSSSIIFLILRSLTSDKELLCSHETLHSYLLDCRSNPYHSFSEMSNSSNEVPVILFVVLFRALVRFTFWFFKVFHVPNIFIYQVAQFLYVHVYLKCQGFVALKSSELKITLGLCVELLNKCVLKFVDLFSYIFPLINLYLDFYSYLFSPPSPSLF